MRRIYSTSAELLTTNESDPVMNQQDWTIDEDFLQRINEWQVKNPKTSILKLLESLCGIADNMTGFIELVPDGAIPARGMVKAIINLVQLAAVCSTIYLITIFSYQIAESDGCETHNCGICEGYSLLGCKYVRATS